MFGDLPRTEEKVAEAPVSEEMETDAAIDMPADTTATVSDDKVDVTTTETVSAFPEVSNEETAQEAIITTEQINVLVWSYLEENLSLRSSSWKS